MEELGLRKAQEVVDRWIEEVGVRYFHPVTNTAILAEEVGEVAHIVVRKWGEQSFKTEEEEERAHEQLGEELADVLFVLLCLSNQLGVDLEEAFRRRMDKKTARDRDRHKNNPKLRD